MHDGSPRTFFDALDAERTRLFVGRAAELAALEPLLDPASAQRVVLLCGPGGSGKTELLHAFMRRAAARGVPTVTLAGDAIQTSEHSFSAALAERLAVVGRVEEGTSVGHAVVIVDAFEHLATLETWLLERLLPSLDARLRVVLAGRGPPSPRWVVHPAWRSMHTTLQLGPLAADEAAGYLARRGIPAERWAAIVARAAGHPLALAIFADLRERDPNATLALGEQPETVRILLAALVGQALDARQRDALWSMALMRRTTEETLAATVDPADGDEPVADDLYTRLAKLSFVRTGPDGLVPHDLVRDLLVVDLSWRFPGRRDAILERAARHLLARFNSAAPAARAQLFADICFLWRDILPSARVADDGFSLSEPRPEDLATLREWVERFHGPRSAELFERWLAAGCDVGVVRGADELPRAMAVQVLLGRLSPDALADDPAVVAVNRLVGDQRAGVVFVRWVLDGEHGEATSPASQALQRWEFETYMQSGIATRGFSVWRDPRHGTSNMPPGMLVAEPGLAHELDGHAYHGIRTDERGQALLPWFVREMFGGLMRPATPAPTLDRTTFEAQVRDALKVVRRAEELARSPLVQTSLVSAGARAAGPLEAARELRALLEASAASLSEDAADAEILRRTYFAARTKQEGVAIELGIPFGTYRRRLAAATDRMIDALWLIASSTVDPARQAV